MPYSKVETNILSRDRFFFFRLLCPSVKGRSFLELLGALVFFSANKDLKIISGIWMEK